MPKKVNGFQIPDGRFFETEQEASYEELKTLVHHEASRTIHIPENYPSEFILFIEQNASLIRDFAAAVCEWELRQKAPEEELDELNKEIKINDG